MAYYDQPASPGSMSTRRLTNRNTNRYSVTHLFSMAAEQDMEVQDELARGKYRRFYRVLRENPSGRHPMATVREAQPALCRHDRWQ